MEFQITPRVTGGKIDETSRPQATDKSKVAAYGKTLVGAESDALNLSPKARLMQSLTATYDKLPGNEAKVDEITRKINESGSHALSSEEIVSGILKGSLFEAI